MFFFNRIQDALEQGRRFQFEFLDEMATGNRRGIF
jgi:hypothetical protein